MFEKLKWKHMSPKEVFEKGFAAEIEGGIEKALPFYTHAAQRGYAGAQYTLATYCYYLANNLLDLKKADEYEEEFLVWLKKAAQQGYAPAQEELGDVYYYGESCEQDLEQTLYWTEKAAQQDFLPALEGIWHMYDRGCGCEPDPEKAEYWKKRWLQQKEEQSKQIWPTYTKKLYGRKVLNEYARFDLSSGN